MFSWYLSSTLSFVFCIVTDQHAGNGWAAVRCWYGAHSCKIVKSGWMLPMVGPCRRSHRLAAVHCEVAQSLWDHSQVIGNSLWERMNGNRYVQRLYLIIWGCILSFSVKMMCLWVEILAVIPVQYWHLNREGEMCEHDRWRFERARWARPIYQRFASGSDQVSEACLLGMSFVTLPSMVTWILALAPNT
jgi:hypothetical protein